MKNQPESPSSDNSQLNNLAYVKQVLGVSQGPNSYPAIYFFWGCAILLGYIVAEYAFKWLNIYWLVTAPLGMVISAWLGARSSAKLGQQDRAIGQKYLAHFSLMVIAIFIAMATKQYQSILLVIALGYALGGLYLEKLMYFVGALAAIVYLCMSFGIITSNLVVGVIFALGLFTIAFAAAKANSANYVV